MYACFQKGCSFTGPKLIIIETHFRVKHAPKKGKKQASSNNPSAISSDTASKSLPSPIIPNSYGADTSNFPPLPLPPFTKAAAPQKPSVVSIGPSNQKPTLNNVTAVQIPKQNSYFSQQSTTRANLDNVSYNQNGTTNLSTSSNTPISLQGQTQNSYFLPQTQNVLPLNNVTQSYQGSLNPTPPGYNASTSHKPYQNSYFLPSNQNKLPPTNVYSSANISTNSTAFVNNATSLPNPDNNSYSLPPIRNIKPTENLPANINGFSHVVPSLSNVNTFQKTSVPKPFFNQSTNTFLRDNAPTSALSKQPVYENSSGQLKHSLNVLSQPAPSSDTLVPSNTNTPLQENVVTSNSTKQLWNTMSSEPSQSEVTPNNTLFSSVNNILQRSTPINTESNKVTHPVSSVSLQPIVSANYNQSLSNIPKERIPSDDITKQAEVKIPIAKSQSSIEAGIEPQNQNKSKKVKTDNKKGEYVCFKCSFNASSNTAIEKHISECNSKQGAPVISSEGKVNLVPAKRGRPPKGTVPKRKIDKLPGNKKINKSKSSRVSNTLPNKDQHFSSDYDTDDDIFGEGKAFANTNGVANERVNAIPSNLGDKKATYSSDDDSDDDIFGEGIGRIKAKENSTTQTQPPVNLSNSNQGYSSDDDSDDDIFGEGKSFIKSKEIANKDTQPTVNSNNKSPGFSSDDESDQDIFGEGQAKLNSNETETISRYNEKQTFSSDDDSDDDPFGEKISQPTVVPAWDENMISSEKIIHEAKNDDLAWMSSMDAMEPIENEQPPSVNENNHVSSNNESACFECNFTGSNDVVEEHFRTLHVKQEPSYFDTKEADTESSKPAIDTVPDWMLIPPTEMDSMHTEMDSMSTEMDSMSTETDSMPTVMESIPPAMHDSDGEMGTDEKHEDLSEEHIKAISEDIFGESISKCDQDSAWDTSSLYTNEIPANKIKEERKESSNEFEADNILASSEKLVESDSSKGILNRNGNVKGMFSCFKCDFTGFSNDAIDKHMKNIHVKQEPQTEPSVPSFKETPLDGKTEPPPMPPPNFNDTLPDPESVKIGKYVCNKFSRRYVPPEPEPDIPDDHAKDEDYIESARRGKYVCYMCNFVGSSNEITQRHFDANHSKKDPSSMANKADCAKAKIFKCSECEYITDDSKDLGKHFKSFHEDKIILTCSECDYRTHRNDRFRRHMQALHSTVPQYYCDKCDYSATLKDNFQRHVRTHDKLPTHKCPEPDCDFATFHAIDLGKHKKFIHKGVKHFRCDHCTYMSQSSYSLKRHDESNHQKEKHLPCTYDGCKYSVPQSDERRLRRHIASVHVKGMTHQCNECDYKANVEQILLRHIRKKHARPEDIEKPVVKKEVSEQNNSNICPQCGKHFSENSNMRTHVKIVHNRIRDFSCHKCDYVCGQKGNLNEHMKRKHGERLYPERKHQKAMKAEAENLKLGLININIPTNEKTSSSIENSKTGSNSDVTSSISNGNINNDASQFLLPLPNVSLSNGTTANTPLWAGTSPMTPYGNTKRYISNEGFSFYSTLPPTFSSLNSSSVINSQPDPNLTIQHGMTQLSQPMSILGETSSGMPHENGKGTLIPTPQSTPNVSLANGVAPSIRPPGLLSTMNIPSTSMNNIPSWAGNINSLPPLNSPIYNGMMPLPHPIGAKQLQQPIITTSLQRSIETTQLQHPNGNNNGMSTLAHPTSSNAASWVGNANALQIPHTSQNNIPSGQ